MDEKIEKYLDEPVLNKTLKNKIKWVIEHPDKAAKDLLDFSDEISERIDDEHRLSNSVHERDKWLDEERMMRCFYEEQCRKASQYVCELKTKLQGLCIDPELKNEIDNIIFKIEGLKGYYEENKILKENAIHNDKVVDKVNWENRLLKDRIDKAIEYLKDNACYENTISELFCDDLNYDNCMELLKILRGEE